MAQRHARRHFSFFIPTTSYLVLASHQPDQSMTRSSSPADVTVFAAIGSKLGGVKLYLSSEYGWSLVGLG
jgi:hypothetical protein